MSMPTDLIDLGPAVSVALIGALVACLPMAVVAWRRLSGRSGDASFGGSDWQRALTLATLFLTLDLVVFGAFTRLTDSGLGCPDWPGCYGSTSPLGAHESIADAQAALPHGPVTHTKAWIEMLHRYLATGVGALITWLMGLAWWQRWRSGRTQGLSPWWPTLTFVWVCAQGAFGALTVTLKLYPLVVTGHLIGGLLGVALLVAQVRAMTPLAAAGAASAGLWSRPVGPSLRRAALVGLGVWWCQVALGGWVSTNAAVLACADFPTCHGQWWPEMDFSQGFTLMRGLGQGMQGEAISLQALMAIHMVHRLGAVVVTVVMLWLIWQAWQSRESLESAGAGRREAQALLALLLWQVVSGLSNVVLGWPLAAALAHTLGAALTVAWLTRMVVAPATGSVVTSSAAQGASGGAAARWAW